MKDSRGEGKEKSMQEGRTAGMHCRSAGTQRCMNAWGSVGIKGSRHAGRNARIQERRNACSNAGMQACRTAGKRAGKRSRMRAGMQE